MRKKPVVLMILDGYGLNDKTEGNAVAMANTPVMDSLMKEYPYVHGNASGLAVGLPEGQMGNSEVGHMNMGAGRIVYQELTRITKEIQDGDFFKNEALLKAIDNCKKNNSALHLMGLLSDGGVHSHITHLYGLLELAKQQGLEKVYVHCFLDGRDTPPASGKSYAEQLNEEMKKIGVGKIASVMGRYYAMDRDNNYDRVQLAYDAMTEGKGLTAACGICGIQESYDREETDEFVKPTVVVEDGKAVGLVQDKDSVIFFNFRPDRAREITRAFCDDDFNFANPDMVGHTGVISAAIKAIETVDECVGKAVQAVKDVDGVLFICADHGNAEQMIDYTTGQPHTAHTTNPVPFILVNYDPAYTLKEGGCLADIVPTLINVMGMEQPAEMTGKSLLIKK